MSPVGTTLGFVGLAFTDRTNIQVLGQPIRLDYHHMDVKLRTMAAQYFGALRKATDKLRRYYECDLPKLEAPGSAIGSDIRLPCYSLYRDLADSVERNITYSSQPIPDKLVFFGESDGIKVCVKFVTRYSKEAHIQCASMGIAPILRGFEALPGGWFMVVMDRIDDVFIPLYTSESRLSVKLRNLVLWRRLIFIKLDMCMATSVTLISWSGKMVNLDSCWWILIGRGKSGRYVIL